MLNIYNNKLAFRTCICLAISQLAYNIFYYGVQGSLERTGFNFGFSMLLIGLHEFFAYLTASYFIKKIKRKKGLFIAIVFTSIIGFLGYGLVNIDRLLHIYLFISMYLRVSGVAISSWEERNL